MNQTSPLPLDALPYPTIRIDNCARIVEINHSLTSLVGYELQDLLGVKVEQIIPQLSLLLNIIEKKQEERLFDVTRNFSQVVTIINLDQKLLNLEVKFKSSHGIHILCFAESENHLLHDCVDNPEYQQAHVVLTFMLKPFWEWNIKTNTVFYSPIVMKLLGYKEEPYNGPASLLEKHLSEDVFKKIQQRLKSLIERKINIYDIEYPITRKDGQEIWVRDFAKVSHSEGGEPTHVFGTLEDITEHVHAIHELRKQNDYLALSERISHSGQWRIDFTTLDVYWSCGIYCIFGVNPTKYMPIITPDHKVMLSGAKNKHLICFDSALKASTAFHYKAAIVTHAGEKRKIEVIGDLEFDEDNQLIGFYGVIRNITQQEKTLGEFKLLALVNRTINVPTFFINEQDKVVYQYLATNIDGKSSGLFEYLNFSIEEYLTLKNQAKREGQVKSHNISFDLFDTVYDLSITYESKEGIYIWIIDNVTEQFKKDQQQAIGSRLALLGNTFGSVSHDINNVLGVALGSIEMLELKIAKGDSNVQDYVDRVKNAIDKGKSVTDRLLAFTRKITVKEEIFDPNKDIEDNKYLLMQMLPKAISLTLKLASDPCTIRFPQGEFINILLNIVLNAKDAINELESKRGDIEISTQCVDDYYLLHINDSGIGIPSDKTSKIFDPFYSSKTVNKGNGIGLANVYNTLHKHQAEIKVSGYGALGGAHFTLSFKTTEQAINQGASPQDSQSLYQQSILVLDDEASIAEFVAMVVEKKGGKVTYASTKDELVKKITGLKACDVFITDISMPELTGREAVTLVKEKFKGVKILSMSGYIGKSDENWGYPILRKPFNSKELCDFLLL